MISFAEKHPELVLEWARENEYSPDVVSYGSNKMIIWNGSCGHTWTATAKNRGNGSGCPYCSGNKALRGYNDLETLYPELVKEWSDSNYPLKPDEVTARADRSVWWECQRCKQKWKARIADRTDGHGCPVCAGEKLVSGINDLATLYPMIAAEWSDRNDKKASMIRPKFRENAWWKCQDCGSEYKAVVDSRVKGRICPECLRISRQENIPFRNVEEERIFKMNAIAHYADIVGVNVVLGSDDIIGVPLDTYFPGQKAAIIYSKPLVSEYRVRRENAKNWLCLNAGIRLFRILPRDGNEYDNCICITLSDCSMDTLSAGLQTVFDILKIPVDVDIVRDMRQIKSRSVQQHME